MIGSAAHQAFTAAVMRMFDERCPDGLRVAIHDGPPDETIPIAGPVTFGPHNREVVLTLRADPRGSLRFVMRTTDGEVWINDENVLAGYRRLRKQSTITMDIPWPPVDVPHRLNLNGRGSAR